MTSDMSDLSKNHRAVLGQTKSQRNHTACTTNLTLWNRRFGKRTWVLADGDFGPVRLVSKHQVVLDVGVGWNGERIVACELEAVSAGQEAGRAEPERKWNGGGQNWKGAVLR
jgi:transposase-like protein